MSKMNPHVVLLTGASSGIGLALARRLSRSAYRVVLTARSRSFDRLCAEFSENERCLVRCLDVTRPSEREDVIREVSERWDGVDILINNAGIAYRSVIEHMTDHDEELQMATNYFGPLALIRLSLPHMRRQRFGRIINISSVGGMMAMPTMGSYSASKFALEGASEALWYELRPWNIKISLVQPGFVRSRSFEHVCFTEQGRSSTELKDEYSLYYSAMGGFIEKLMLRASATSDSIAERVMKLMQEESPALRVPGTLDASFFSLLRRLLPRKLYHGILYANLPKIKEWGK